MNRGLLLKAGYEIWPATLVCGGLLFGVEAILAYVIPSYQEQFTDALLQIRGIQAFVQAMLGIETDEILSPQTFMAFAWVHPVVLSLSWAHPIICATRVPAGEIDSGTADILLSWPASRWQILCSEGAVWLLAAAALMLLALLGNVVGGWSVAESLRPDLKWRLVVLANLYLLVAAVAGGTWLVSALSDRRGRAITFAFILLLASFLLNYLAQLWEPARRVEFLGLLAYYRPVYVLRDGIVPWRDMAVLSAVAAFLWVAAGLVFSRRDVCTL